MKTRAAVAFEAKKPLEIVELDLEGPKAGEVLVEIMATGVCHTDAYTLDGFDSEGIFPSVLGHEGAGIVREVGPGVTSVKPGDHVIPLYTPECRQCKSCLSGKTNLCTAIRATQGKGLMPDGTTRFSYKGQPIFHYMGCSTFSNFTVLPEIAVAKIREDAPFKTACYIGCGVTTGVGAVVNTAKVQVGDNVVIFGLGGIGLNVIQGARLAGAAKIVGVDINPDREEWGRKFGMTHFLNSKGMSREEVVAKVVELTDGGADYTFDATGNTEVMRTALEACHRGWGTSIIIGVAEAGKEIATRPFQLVTGRNWRGTAFGGAKGRTDVPKIVDWYMQGKIEIDPMITHVMGLEEINTAFDLMHAGKRDLARQLAHHHILGQPGIGADAIEDRRVDKGRVHRIAADVPPALGAIKRDRFAEHPHRRLAGVVAGHRVGCDQPGDRTDVDDRSGLVVLHQRQRLLAAEEHRIDVDGKAAAPVLQRAAFDMAAHADAGVVDQHRQPAQVLFGRGNGAIPVFGAGHIVDDRKGGAGAAFGVDRLGHGGNLVGVDVGQQHAGPFARQRGGMRRAQPLCRARDQRLLARNPACHDLLSRFNLSVKPVAAGPRETTAVWCRCHSLRRAGRRRSPRSRPAARGGR